MANATNISLEALDLTHVLYDPTSNLSLALALATLSPILLMACYGALSVVTRDFLIINMWIGQLSCEGANWMLKHAVKQDRPFDAYGSGYGFPSSHSQFMGFFASFLLLHLHYKHIFQSTSIKLLDMVRAVFVRLCITGLAAVVCYSRLYLNYHTIPQVLWGFGIGIVLGVSYYGLTEYLPFYHPNSLPGQARVFLLKSPILTWCRIQDRWAIWSDGGHEEQYIRWRKIWEKKYE